jgi:transposase
VPAIQPYIIEAIWEQFAALLPERKTDHPLGCHRPRIPDRVIFEKLVEVLVFGCAYSGGSPMRSAPPPPYAADVMSG